MFDRDFKGVWIPKEIWLNENLSITEKALFAEIDSLDTNSHCTAGNDYFAKFLGVTERTISNSITHLKELGLIRSEFDGRVRTLRVENFSRQSRKNCDILNHNISNNQLNIIKEDNNITTNKEDTYNKNKEQIIRFVEDFNKFCPSLPRCIRMTVKRNKGISNLLKKYSYDEILKCFEKLEASDFCTGRSGRWRADIDFILREDKFINVLEGKYDNQGKRCNVETISHGEKKQMTEEERERIIKNGKKF